jgi:vesicle-fusing ATPase
MNSLEETSAINENSHSSKRSVILSGKSGTGKTTLAINFVKHKSFSYLKIISPENLVGQTESEKIHNISKIFEDAYKTINACIVIDSIERLIDYSPVGRRFSNNILQAILLLLEKTPPKEENKLLLIGTTSSYYHL